MWLLNLERISWSFGEIYLLLIRSLFFLLFGLVPEGQSFALQKLKIKEKMLEAKLHKDSLVALKNKRLDLSSNEKVSEVETFF